jgi:hypothetical protein
LEPVQVEDHSRQLKRLRPLAPGEANAPEARRAALAEHGAWLEAAFREEAQASGIRIRSEAPLRLRLRITSLGEVRGKYLFYGIASGVAWGVGTGLVAHDPHLAVGLGVYELFEETAFWVAGSSLFGAFSAPVVAEAELCAAGQSAPVWTETYYVLSGRSWLKGLPPETRKDRRVQLRGALQELVKELLKDLEALPGFPGNTSARLREPWVRERLLSQPGKDR